MTRQVGSTLSLLNDYSLKLNPSRSMNLLNLHLRSFYLQQVVFELSDR